MKDNGFSFLLLIYYNQVLGLPASTVGLVIMLALIADALVDPLIGHASDRTRSRWGRRHPWMYAAVVPCALAYWALWSPPAGLGATGLALWLFALTFLVRLLVAAVEIPSASLVAELTDDYDERTRYIGWRYFFGWAGGIAAGVVAFAVFLQPTATQPVGVLNRDGYAGYALAASIAIAATVLASALLTHRYIPRLRTAGASAGGLAAHRAQVRAALANRSFLSVLLAGMFSAMAAGLAGALNVYFNTYLWRLSSDQISLLILSSLLAAMIALVAAPVLVRRGDKKRAALATFLAAILIGPAMLLARLAGLMPENGSPALLPLLLLHNVVLVAVFITASIIVTAMLTDTIEANERATGERTEGLYFGANFFVQKCVTGIGLFASGVIIDAVGLPRGADPAAVPAGVLDRLVLAYVPVTVGLYLVALACLARYAIDRRAHAETLAALGR